MCVCLRLSPVYISTSLSFTFLLWLTLAVTLKGKNLLQATGGLNQNVQVDDIFHKETHFHFHSTTFHVR